MVDAASQYGLSQLLQPRPAPGFDRAQRLAQLGADFTLRHAVKVGKLQHLAFLRRKQCDLPPQKFQPLAGP